MTTALPTPTPEQRQQIAARFQLVHELLAKSQIRAAAAALEPCCETDPANPTYRRLLHTLRRQQMPAGTSPGLLARLRRWRATRLLRAAQRQADPAGVLAAAENL